MRTIPAVYLLSVASAVATACQDAPAHGGEDTEGEATTANDAAGTGDDVDETGSAPTCPFLDDGVCDEPGNCVLGTDDADCVAACGSEENLHLFAAACAYRNPPTPPADDGRPSGGAGLSTGTFDRTVEVESGENAGKIVDRHYRLHVPATYDPKRSTPLVIVMPGHRVSHFSLPTYTGLLRSADHNGFIVVFAEQEWRTTTEPRWSWWTDWNWPAGADGNPDIKYLTKVINAVATDYNVDLRRIYTAGHSRGAAMAFIAALELSDYIAGACVQAGFSEFGYLDARLSTWSGRKVPMWFMHGAQDPDVPVGASDALVHRLVELGWEAENDFVYRRLEGVTHIWNTPLNQEWWDFLRARPLPE